MLKHADLLLDKPFYQHHGMVKCVEKNVGKLRMTFNKNQLCLKWLNELNIC